MSNTSARQQLAWVLFLGALFTLPTIGLGMLQLTTGRDWGAGLQLSWVLMAAAVIFAAPELMRFLFQYRRHCLVSLGPAAAALALSVAGIWLAQSGETVASSLWRYGKQVLQLMVMAFFVLMPIFFLARGNALSTMAKVVVSGLIGQLFYSVFQAIHFFHPNELMSSCEVFFTSNPAILSGSEQLYLNNNLLDIPRLRGTACEPLYFGNYLLMVLPLVWLTGWRRWVNLILATAVIALLFLTWSRGAWLGGLAQLGLMLLWGSGADLKVWNPIRLKIFVGMSLLIMIGMAFGRAEVILPWQRLIQSFSSVDWSNLTRLYSMQAAWRGFELSPVVGLGWGQFGFHFASLVDPMGLQSMFSWPVVNNFPLAILCETGILGASAAVWICRRIWLVLVSQWHSVAPSKRRTLLLLACAVVGVWAQLLTFSQYNLPHIWVSLGFLVGHLAYESKITKKSGVGS